MIKLAQVIFLWNQPSHFPCEYYHMPPPLYLGLPLWNLVLITCLRLKEGVCLTLFMFCLFQKAPYLYREDALLILFDPCDKFRSSLIDLHTLKISLYFYLNAPWRISFFVNFRKILKTLLLGLTSLLLIRFLQVSPIFRCPDWHMIEIPVLKFALLLLNMLTDHSFHSFEISPHEGLKLACFLWNHHEVTANRNWQNNCLNMGLVFQKYFQYHSASQFLRQDTLLLNDMDYLLFISFWM